MNPEIKAQWLADLRSGEFKQGKHYLTQVLEDGTEKNCCLGVLCEQALKAGIVRRDVERNADDDANFINYTSVTDEEDSAGGILPGAVAKWAGIAGFNPRVAADSDTPGYHVYLSSLNDQGSSFDEIASLIENQL